MFPRGARPGGGERQIDRVPDPMGGGACGLRPQGPGLIPRIEARLGLESGFRPCSRGSGPTRGRCAMDVLWIAALVALVIVILSDQEVG